jgi:hypothetical protein
LSVYCVRSGSGTGVGVGDETRVGIGEDVGLGGTGDEVNDSVEAIGGFKGAPQAASRSSKNAHEDRILWIPKGLVLSFAPKSGDFGLRFIVVLR